MIQSTQYPATKFQAVIRSNVEKTPQWASLDPEIREGIEVLSLVLPFRTNKYVMDELIDWTNVPNDPIFNLVFPRSGMLEEDEFNQVRDLVRCQAEKAEINAAVDRIRNRLNPHPAGQMTHNVPHVDGEPIPGCSTNTARLSSSSQHTDKHATPTAPSASAGPSSLATKISNLPTRKWINWSVTCDSTKKSPMCFSPAVTPWS